MLSVNNVEYILNGIVRVHAENSEIAVAITLPKFELQQTLEAGVQFTMTHSTDEIDGDVCFYGTISLFSDDYILISNGGLMMSIRAKTKNSLKIGRYGQSLFTTLNFKTGKKRGRPPKSAPSSS